VVDITKQYWTVQNTNPGTQVFTTDTSAGAQGTFMAVGSAAFATYLGLHDPQTRVGGGVVGTANNGSGLIRVQVGSAQNFTTGMVLDYVGNNSGDAGAAAITVIDGTHFDIQGSTFTIADTGGNLYGATWIDTAADLYAAIDAYNRLIQPAPPLSVSSGVNYTLATPVPSFFSFNPGTTAGLTVTLPQMNLPGALAKGRPLVIFNPSITPFALQTFGGAQRFVIPGSGNSSGASYQNLYLTDNSTQSGTISIGPAEEALSTIGDTNTSMVFAKSPITIYETVTTFTAPRTWTLPPSTSDAFGKFLLIVDGKSAVSSTNTLTIARFGSNQINTAAGLVTSIVFNRPRAWVLLQNSDALGPGSVSLWNVVGGKGALVSTDLGDVPFPLSSGGTAADLSATGAAHNFLKQSSAGAAITVGPPASTDLSDLPIPLSSGGTHADLSATGGAHQVLKQSSSGAAVTVGQLASTDLSDLPVPVSSGGTAYTGGALPTYTATLVPDAGSITQSGSASDLQIGKLVYYTIAVTITNITGGPPARASLTLPVAPKRDTMIFGYEATRAIFWRVELAAGSTTTTAIRDQNNTVIVPTINDEYISNGFYEAQ
jgi:hypothetical protein